MQRSKKIVLSILMLIIAVAVGFFENKVPLQNGEMPENKEEESTPVDAIKEQVTTDASTEQEVVDTATEQVIADASTEDGSFIYSQALLDEEIEGEIDQMLLEMSIEEKVGQLFFIKNDGRFNESILEDYPVGGVILFYNDFKYKTAETVTEELAAFQEKSQYPLLIGVDEEGGKVIRLSKNRNLAEYPFLSPRELYAQGGYEAITEDAHDKSKLLLSYGINVNFAPVCDVSTNQGEYMYHRSFGESAADTAQYVSLVVSAMNEEQIGSVLKHFPGYGGNGDTHTSIVRDDRSYEQFETEDFLPFAAGIDAGAECVLVSHNIVNSMDESWPASLSYNVHDILRNELGFGGVIITDDLMMSGVSNYVSEKESAVQAVLAGNDMILSTDFKTQYRAVLAAVQEGTITEERLDQSVRRILRWKYNLGLFEE